MRLILFLLISLEIVIRYHFSNRHRDYNLQILLFSAIIQSLMIYPIIGESLFVINERGIDYFGAPFERNIAILFPSVIALSFLTFKRRNNWRIKEIIFPTVVIVLFLLYSYLTPFNYSYNATNIVLLLFAQIFLVIYICKSYLTTDQMLRGFFDGLVIVILIEFLISVSFSLLKIDFFQLLFEQNLDEAGADLRTGSFIRRSIGTFGQPNRLGGFCALSFVFFLSCRLFNYKKQKSLIFALICFVTIVLSQSRSSLLATVCSSIIMFLFYLNKRRQLSFARLIRFLVLLLIIGMFLLNMDFVTNMFFQSDVNEMEEARGFHYMLGFAAIQKTHYWGVGLNSHVYYMYNELFRLNFGEFYYTRAIHSFHMCILVETGILGFLMWLYYCITRIKIIIVTPFVWMENPILWFSFLGMLLIVIIHGVTDNVYFHYQHLMILLLIGSFYRKTSNIF